MLGRKSEKVVEKIPGRIIVDEMMGKHAEACRLSVTGAEAGSGLGVETIHRTSAARAFPVDDVDMSIHQPKWGPVSFRSEDREDCTPRHECRGSVGPPLLP